MRYAPRYLLATVALAAMVLSRSPAAFAADEKLDAKRDLIVLIGKKLSVEEQAAEEDSMDSKFKARFRVLHRVFGRYGKRAISFTAYDHYGEPAFSRYETVLLFVARYKGGLYHEKYQFFPVYQTANGRWASCGNADQWEGQYHHGKLQPVPIKFTGEVVDEATKRPCTEGNYVEDLLRMKQNGVLKARGWIF